MSSEDARVSRAEARRDYQRKYYVEVVKPRRRRNRYADVDPVQRERAKARELKRSAISRARVAYDRFTGRIRAHRKLINNSAASARVTLIDGAPTVCYSSDTLGREIGREGRIVHMWLREGVLPGATVWVTQRHHPVEAKRHMRAYFSREFCESVYRACTDLFYIDGRGSKTVLKRLVQAELRNRKVGYVTRDGAIQGGAE